MDSHFMSTLSTTVEQRHPMDEPEPSAYGTSDVAIECPASPLRSFSLGPSSLPPPTGSQSMDQQVHRTLDGETTGHTTPTRKRGDWTCHVCGLHHKAEWVQCRKCRWSKFELRELCKIGDGYSMVQQQLRKGRKGKDRKVTATIEPGDRICPHCGNHNYAQHTRCHTCTKRN